MVKQGIKVRRAYVLFMLPTYMLCVQFNQLRIENNCSTVVGYWLWRSLLGSVFYCYSEITFVFICLRIGLCGPSRLYKIKLLICFRKIRFLNFLTHTWCTFRAIELRLIRLKAAVCYSQLPIHQFHCQYMARSSYVLRVTV